MGPTATAKGRVLAIGLVAITAGIVGCSGDDGRVGHYHGVRLGMTAAQVREAMAPLGGTFTISQEESLQVLEWEGQSAKLAKARFELHLGMLVAGRFDLTGTHPPRLEQTPAAIRVTAPHAEASRVTIVARDCPEHQDEVRRFLNEAGQ